jgi:BlaI family penicillinase repressor
MTLRNLPVSETEFEVLKALWLRGPSTVRDLNETLRGQRRRWAYTTVQTLLRRLEEKGYVTSDKTGMAHVFRAAMTRDDLLQDRLDELAKQLCDGATAPLVLALVEGRKFSTDDIQHFRELLDRLEADQPSAPKSKKPKPS